MKTDENRLFSVALRRPIDHGESAALGEDLAGRCLWELEDWEALPEPARLRRARPTT